MTESYVIWDHADVPNALVPKNLVGLDDFEDEVKLRMGHPFNGNWPRELAFTADQDFPDDLLLIDGFANTEGVFPVSNSVKEFLEGKCLRDVEFVPIKILDHRSNPVADYWLVHPTLVVDCIDRDRSDFETSFVNPDRIEFVSRLVLHDSAPRESSIFRIQSMPSVVCLSAAVAKELDERDFTGFSWKKISDFTL